MEITSYGFTMPVKSSRIEFSSATITFFIHATEDGSRLVNKVSRSLGIPVTSVELDTLEGHYGNVLHSAKAHIVGQGADQVSKSILSRLDSQSKATIISDLEKSVDQHDTLYLRLDRQLLGEGLALGSEEPIRIKLKPKNRYGNRRVVRDAYRGLLDA